jgi:16S rRNA (cytidine1402-2'-O)-methyltransferase
VRHPGDGGGTPGRLVVCATPIGNLGDVTMRVLDALRDADVIEAEDTRVTRKLLARYEIRTPLERFDEQVARKRAPEVLDRVRAGATVALVSDAGMPGISDPGSHLVAACLDAGLPVDVLPGASAVPTALVASGLPTDAFYFGGFLPRKAGERARRLAALADLDATLVFYEAPGRTAASAAALADAFPGREAAMARELTKLHEEVLRAPVAELADALNGRELKGEVVLLVGPPSGEPATPPADEVLAEAVRRKMGAGLSRKDAATIVARELGVSRKSAYEASLRER